MYFQKRRITFRVTRNNNPKSVKSAYQIASEFTTAEIIEFMKTHPKTAETFKSQIKKRIESFGGTRF